MSVGFAVWVPVALIRNESTREIGCVLCGFIFIPTVFAIGLQKSQICRRLRKKWGVGTSDSDSHLQAIAGIPFLPVICLGMIWVWFFYTLLGMGKPGEWTKTLTEKVNFLVVGALIPCLILAYYLGYSRQFALATYFSVAIAYLSLTGPLNGLGIEKGVMKFFGAQKPHSSPKYILGCALLFIGSFGCLHYELALADPKQYANLHSWQDAVYFSVITASTVGYGDISPLGHAARWLCSFEVIGGFCLLVVAVNVSMTVWIQSHQPTLTNSRASVPPSDIAGQ